MKIIIEKYNLGKNNFIKKIESEAILWYDRHNR